MLKIYHNPRCAKSREGLLLLEKSGKEFEIIKYMENVPDKEELKQTISLLGISPDQLLRKNEAIWKEKYKGRTLSDEEIIEAMIAHPGLIERPIVINGNKVAIGRPSSNISQIL